MRKVYLEDLPHHPNGTMNWMESVGKSVKFVYDDIEGVLAILGYDTSRYYLKIQYKDRIKDIFVGSLKDCRISELIGLKHREYKYNIGDIIFDSFEIKQQTKMKVSQKNKCLHKAYMIQCTKCKYEFERSEDALNHKNYNKQCPNCGIFFSQAKIDINDLWTTNPEIAQMLNNPEDGYKLTRGSGRKTDWRCPHCNGLIKDRDPYYVWSFGLKCGNCKDGISYPEKIMRTILQDQNIEFETHKIFAWSNRKEYDFYLPALNWIIEMHGKQHYTTAFSQDKDRDVEAEQANDRYKKRMAKQNGIKRYIVISCCISEFDYILNNIMKSTLQFILSRNMNLDKIKKESAKLLMIEVCNMWNNGNNDIDDMAEKVGVTDYTIATYLKRGKRLGICTYDGNKTKKALNNPRRSKAVRCITTDKCFETLSRAGKEYKVEPTSITISIKKNWSAGKLPDGTKLYWEYID